MSTRQQRQVGLPNSNEVKQIRITDDVSSLIIGAYRPSVRVTEKSSVASTIEARVWTGVGGEIAVTTSLVQCR